MRRRSRALGDLFYENTSYEEAYLIALEMLWSGSRDDYLWTLNEWPQKHVVLLRRDAVAGNDVAFRMYLDWLQAIGRLDLKFLYKDRIMVERAQHTLFPGGLRHLYLGIEHGLDKVFELPEYDFEYRYDDPPPAPEAPLSLPYIKRKLMVAACQVIFDGGIVDASQLHFGSISYLSRTRLQDWALLRASFDIPLRHSEVTAQYESQGKNRPHFNAEFTATMEDITEEVDGANVDPARHRLDWAIETGTKDGNVSVRSEVGKWRALPHGRWKMTWAGRDVNDVATFHQDFKHEDAPDAVFMPGEPLLP